MRRTEIGDGYAIIAGGCFSFMQDMIRLRPRCLSSRMASIGDIVFFFFSSRRRHTRFDCDWSSDVCSSDLEPDENKNRERHRKLGAMIENVMTHLMRHHFANFRQRALIEQIVVKSDSRRDRKSVV